MLVENSDYRIEIMDIESDYDVDLIKNFLVPLGFDFSNTLVDYAMILYNLNDQIIGTGASLGGVLKFVVVAPKFRESSAFAQIVTHLNNRILYIGNKTIFVYTKPENSIKFQGLGFNEIAVVEPLYALLEMGYRTIENYQKYLKSNIVDLETTQIASIVVNCNPFTRGHQYLIEKASSENDIVYLFVVEEDRSVFPFEIRLDLIKKGVAHLDNIVILNGSNYIVSGATFPSYFLKNEDVDDVAKKQTELDITIFIKYIVPILNIKKRYIGTEMYCKTTSQYNKTMMSMLPKAGIEVIEVNRKEINNNYISASKIRDAIKHDDIESFKDFLPITTYEFLQSPQAENIIEKIKQRNARH
jgi:[citrate (pro-3S)-lyase] ligase